MAGGMSEDRESGVARGAKRSETGATASDSAWVAIAEVVALHTGHKCEEAGAVLKSAQ